MAQRVHKGFTLIELLVVVAIIGILAAVVLAGVSLSRSKARDAKRLVDLRTIATALEFHYSEVGHYPISQGQINGCAVPGNVNWIPDGSDYSWNTKYVPTMPRDPSEDCAAVDQHSYSYQSDGKTYKITTKLENPSPPGSTIQTFTYNGSFFQPVFDDSPIIVTIQTSASNPTGDSPIPLVITFSREVVDFSQNTLFVLRGVVSGFSVVLASLFDVFVTPTDNNTVVVSLTSGAVHDQNGIGNQAAQFSIIYDSLLPHPAISPAPLPATVSGPFSLDVNFTIAVVDFSANKISVANGHVTAFSQQNGSNYTFTVSPTAPGTVTVSIPGDVTQSAAGNGNVASNSVSTEYTGQ